jgi:two-component system capsular synthesis sensor histidine kinase RcsC
MSAQWENIQAMTTTFDQDGVLARLHRYQTRLVLGGGIVITLLVLLAGVMEVVASVMAYVARTNEEVSVDIRNVMDFTARATATLRNNVQNMELAWELAEAPDSKHLQTYIEGGNWVRVNTPSTAPSLLVLGSTHQDSTARASRYIHLAEQMAPATAVIAARNAGDLTAYFYSPERSFLILAVAPWPGAGWQARIAASRDSLFETLTRLTPDNPTRDTAKGLPAFQWLAPYDSPLTGTPAIRVAAPLIGRDQQSFGTLVFELPLASLAAKLPDTGLQGSCMILGADGSLIFSCQQAGGHQTLSEAREALADGLGRSRQTAYQQGHVLSGWPLGDTSWTLVYAQSWQQIAKGVAPQVVVTALTSGLIILATWLVLLLVKWRLLAPAVAQSRRVFENEQLSRILVETAPIGLGLIAVDNEQPLLRSPAMIDMARHISRPGTSLSALFARYFKQRLTAPDAPQAQTIRQEDLGVSTLDGQHIDLSVSIAQARYQGRDVLVTAFADVTTKKRLEQQLREARQAAEAANAAKSGFLAAMSHEIRTPLNAILGNLELLAYSPLNLRQHDRLKTIQATSDALLAIISDVLDFSRIEANELRLEDLEFDALEIAARALMIFAPVAQAKGLTLLGELDESISLPMCGDPTRMGQVIHNLLSNAIKFTDKGQVLLRLTADTVTRTVTIEVEDSGIGLTAEQQTRLFSAFSQADTSINRRYGGTGLGLALCSRLTQAMGGSLVVQSEPGRGSRFTLRLPLGAANGHPDLPHFAHDRLLLVAASADCRAYLTRVLQRWGLQVRSYSHPAQLQDDALEDVDTLILWGSRQTWHADDENRLVEKSSWVIDCTEDGPADPVAAGRVLIASVFGLRGLAAALRYCLQGKPLAKAERGLLALAKPLKVLIAEDNAVNRRLFEEQLELLGCLATTVEDGAKALACLAQESFDVLLTDLSMPDMDGYDLALQVRQRWPAVPVLAVTAHVTSQERARCEAVGMTRVLSKPLSLRDLGQTLAEVTGTEWGGKARSRGGVLAGDAVPDDIQRVFRESCKASVATLRRAQDASDVAAILAELHSLRGAMGVFDMQHMAELCMGLEQKVLAMGLSACSTEVKQLCDALQSSVISPPESLHDLLEQMLSLADAKAPEDAMAQIAVLARQAQQRLRDG